jgi:hypothetical protein
VLSVLNSKFDMEGLPSGLLFNKMDFNMVVFYLNIVTKLIKGFVKIPL